jgi:non-specific serine/threonine protein kinase
MAKNIPELEDIVWDCLILDEAQAIKNPSTKQTRQIKKLKGNMRIAMTGTPIENDLSNLWSLFDFLNKGLLGSSQEFRDFCRTLDQKPQGYARLKAMISPFMLRRIKTDKTIISDLPEKLEQNEYVELSKKQTVLYRKYVARLAERLNEAEGMERRGMVLASLSKLKQICNHPDQYMGQDAYDPKESGKFQMLREICETIYEKHERVLIFTQFKEIIPYLDDFLCEVFHGRRGFVLHGGTSAANRNKMVEEFQSEKYIPYMILSVKAGGTGLTLTNANHVIHFDRWWNPAVENQATDRAYRIGQTQKVMVHKLISRGTIEEKIDAMIESKKELAENVVGSGGESWITEMSNEQLLSIFTLDEE